MPSTAARSQRLDALKFFAILLVVASHVLRTPELYPAFGHEAVFVITRFNMPLFFFLSGFVLVGREMRPLGPTIQRKFGRLMIPRYAWLLVQNVLLGASVTAGAVLSELGRATLSAQGLWFLYVLFAFLIVFLASYRLRPRDSTVIAVAAVMALLPMVTPAGWYLGHDSWPLYPFFAGGYLAAKHRGRLRRWEGHLRVAGPILFLLLLVVAWPSAVSGSDPAWYFPLREALHSRGLRGSYAAIEALRYLIGASGICASWSLYRALPDSWIAWQAWAGRRTLGVYVTHQYFRFLAFGGTAVAAVASTAVVTAGALAITLVIERVGFLRGPLLGEWRARTRAGEVRASSGEVSGRP